MGTNVHEQPAATAEAGLQKVREVADRLRLHTKVVTRMVLRGDFPNAVKLGRDWRIPASDVDAYLAARRVKPEGGGA